MMIEQVKNKFIKVFKKPVKIFQTIEEYLIVVLLTTMIVTSLLEVLFRVFSQIIQKLFPVFVANSQLWGNFTTFLPNLSVLVKYSVLWTGLIAAGVATALSKHIKIDLVGRFTKGRLRSLVLAFTNMVSGAVCILISFFSIAYIKNLEFVNKDVPEISLPLLYIISFIVLITYVVSFFLYFDFDKEEEKKYRKIIKIGAISLLVLFSLFILFIILLYFFNKDIINVFTNMINFPRWILLLIIPFGFGLIGIRFLLHMIIKIYNIIINREDEEVEDLENILETMEDEKEEV